MSAYASRSLCSPHTTSVRNVSAVTEDQVQYEDATGDPAEDNLLYPEVYLSLVWHGGQLGVAHYDLASLQIHVMCDSFECDDFSLTKQILKETQPCVIILSSIQDGRLISCLKKIGSADTNSSCSQSSGSKTEVFKIEFLPNSDFSYEVSKRRILGMKLPGIPGHYSDEERKLHFASIIPLGQTNMVRAVGGLYKYLERNRVGVELEDTLTSVPLLGFRTYSPESYIQIDTVTYMALNIFDTEIHPSVFKFGGSSGKEGLSLFGILNRCKSSIGSRMLRQWFLRPVKNAALLGQRHEAVSFFVTPCNMDIVSCLQGCLKHIKYLPKILWRMSKAQATVGDLVALSKTIYHAVYIGKISRAQPQTVDIFRKIGTAFTDDLHRCANLIHRTIDFEESKKLKKFVVKPNVDEALDAKKRLFHGVPDILNRVAREELEGLSEEIDHCKASYLPQLGYLLVIDMPEGKTDADDHTIEGLQFIFASNDQLFYKSARTRDSAGLEFSHTPRELDTQLGDIQLEISDLEINILHGLQSAILENTPVLLDVMEMAAELDCLMALATCACEFIYTRPKLVQEGVIDIKAGRHPLQEMCCSPYVPNDTVMGSQNSRIQLLTGPNACGKSVYLKQVALIVFMSHIGSFVPAERACIGPVDRFFSRIKSMESVSSGMSTFLQDSLQICRALHDATQNSLVIVDEFGKGTESVDGLALLTAVIKFWIHQRAASPCVLISTHYHSIIQQKLLPPSPHLKLLTLDTLMNGSDLVFLYQIKEGSTSSSYACHIAAQTGIPQTIIKRGQQVSELISQNKCVPFVKDSSLHAQSKRHEQIVRGFMHLDLEKDNVQIFLKNFVMEENASTHTNQSLESAREKSGQQQATHTQENQQQKNSHHAPSNVTKPTADSYLTALRNMGTTVETENSLDCISHGNFSSSNNHRMDNMNKKVEGKTHSHEIGAVAPNTLQAQTLKVKGMTDSWSKENHWQAFLKRQTTSDALELHSLGVAAECFTKTPLAKHAGMKRKPEALSSSSKDEAKNSKTDEAATTTSLRSCASNSASDLLKSDNDRPSFFHNYNHSKQTKKVLQADERNFLEGHGVTGSNSKTTPCQPYLSKLIMRRADEDITPMLFPPDSTTDLPATSNSSDDGLQEQRKGEMAEKQLSRPLQKSTEQVACRNLLLSTKSTNLSKSLSLD